MTNSSTNTCYGVNPERVHARFLQGQLLVAFHLLETRSKPNWQPAVSAVHSSAYILSDHTRMSLSAPMQHQDVVPI